MKFLRIKHYGYIALTALLLLVSLSSVVTNLRSAKADVGQVTITSPTPDQKISTSNQVIRGRAPALKKISVFDGRSRIGETTSDVNGNWSIDWKKFIPGEHQLNAYLVDGSLYRTNPLSVNSVQVKNINSGQEVGSFAAGLAMPSLAAYDSNNNSTYVINKINHSVSVINPATGDVIDTITYSNADSLKPTEYDSKSCRCQNFTYHYDKQNRNLYIFDLERIHVINTESNSVNRTITVDMPTTKDEYTDPPEYKLYIDPQSSYVYLYVAGNAFTEQPIQRYSTATGEKDQSWAYNGSGVVGGPGGDVYFINKTPGEAVDSAKSYLYKYEQDNQQVSIVDLSSAGCLYADGDNLAVSTNQSSVYVGCSIDGNVAKQIAVNTNDGSLTNLDISSSGDVSWLTQGNIVADKFALVERTYTGPINSGGDPGYSYAVKSVNTSDNTLQPSIDLDVNESGNSLNSDRVIKSSFVISQSGWFSFMTSNNNVNLKKYSTADNALVSSHTYQQGEINVTGNVEDVLFTGGDSSMYVFSAPRNVINKIDVSTGQVSEVQSGAGSGIKVYPSVLANKLFSIAETSYVSAGEAIPASSRLTVSNLSTGAYDTSIRLNDSLAIFNAILSPSGDKLYLFAINPGLNEGNLQISRLDTMTLAIDKTYNPITYDSGDVSRLLLNDETNTGFIGDELVFGGVNKVYLLNTELDTIRNYDNSEENSSGSSYIKVPFAIDPTGKYIAVMNNPSSGVKVLNVSDLSLKTTVDTPNSFAYSPGFTYDGKLIIQDSSGNLGKFDPGTGDAEFSSGSAVLDPLKSTNTSSGYCALFGVSAKNRTDRYIVAQVVCAAPSIDPLYTDTFYHEEFIVVLDPDNLALLGYIKAEDAVGYSNSSLEYLDLLLMDQADVEISSASQNVTAIADKVTIIKPTNGKQLKSGKYTITGTAAPNQTLSLLVDGASIGQVTANQYGYWEKSHTFVTGNKQVKAQFTAPGYDKAYIDTFEYTVNGESVTPKTSTSVINTKTGAIEAKLSEDGVLGMFSIMNRAKDRLHKVGMTYTLSPDGQMTITGTDLLTYDIEKNILLSDKVFEMGSTIDPTLLEQFLSAASTGDGISLSGSALSGDGESIYVTTNLGYMFKAEVATAKVTQIYDLGQQYKDALANISTPFPVRAASVPVVVDSRDEVFLGYPDGSGIVRINTLTGQLNNIDLPDGVQFIKAVVDEDKGRVYSYITYDDGGNIAYSMSSGNLDTLDTYWTMHAEGYAGLAPDVILSPDKESLITSGYQIVDGDIKSSFTKINTETGSVSGDLVPTGQDVIDAIGKISNTSTLSTRIATDARGDRMYSSIWGLGTGGAIVSIDRNGSAAEIIYDTNDKREFSNLMVFAAFSNNFIKTIPQQKVSAVSNITVPGELKDMQNPTTTGDPKPKPPSDPPTVTNKPEKTIEKIISQTKIKSSIKSSNQALKEQSAINLFNVKLLAAIKRFAISVPLPIVNVFPYLLFTLLLVLIGYYLYQTQKQLRREDRLRDIYEKQKVLAEEKRNFLELASHYLRTPLTYIKAGSDIILRNKQNESAATELSESVGHLSLFIESLVEEASSNSQIEAVEVPKRSVWSPLLTKSFILPVAGFGAALGVFYLIFGVIGGINFGPARYVTQLLIMFIVVQLFYGMFKNHQKIIDEEELMSKTLNSEAALDHTRSKLMQDAGQQLQTRTAHLKTVINKLESADTSKAIMQQGVDRLSELSGAFALVGKLESEVMLGSVENVSVRTLAADIIQPMVGKFKEKHVKVEVSGFEDDITLNTNKPLAELTLKTLLSNALGASKVGSGIVVKCLHKDGRVAFQVIDHGEGIPKDKIDRLFKPFVRVGPVTTFNREGIGLSLYLDRLIMHSIGGEVEIVSRFKHGTTATAIFNQKKTA